jgi:hypothetical protein
MPSQRKRTTHGAHALQTATTATTKGGVQRLPRNIRSHVHVDSNSMTARRGLKRSLSQASSSSSTDVKTMPPNCNIDPAWRVDTRTPTKEEQEDSELPGFPFRLVESSYEVYEESAWPMIARRTSAASNGDTSSTNMPQQVTTTIDGTVPRNGFRETLQASSCRQGHRRVRGRPRTQRHRIVPQTAIRSANGQAFPEVSTSTPRKWPSSLFRSNEAKY